MKKFGIIQNLGWLDRVLRVSLGGAILVVGVSLILGSKPDEVGWFMYLFLFSIYPVLTGIIGWDPLYDQFKIRTCGTSERNQCGSFPYEVDAALGNRPVPTSDTDNTLKQAPHGKPQLNTK